SPGSRRGSVGWDPASAFSIMSFRPYCSPRARTVVRRDSSSSVSTSGRTGSVIAVCCIWLLFLVTRDDCQHFPGIDLVADGNRDDGDDTISDRPNRMFHLHCF